MTQQKFRLMNSPLTGNMYITTKYKDLGDGNFQAINKIDVTEEFKSINSQTLTRVLERMKNKCYCKSGEGTFISKTKDSKQYCVYCHAKQIIKEEFGE